MTNTKKSSRFIRSKFPTDMHFKDYSVKYETEIHVNKDFRSIYKLYNRKYTEDFETSIVVRQLKLLLLCLFNILTENNKKSYYA